MFEYDRLALDIAQQFGDSARRAAFANSSPTAPIGQLDGTRRFSGESQTADGFDCGASSGYGSPGAAGTPLASPAPSSFVASKLYAPDQGFCDDLFAHTASHDDLADFGDITAFLADMGIEEPAGAVGERRATVSTSSSSTYNDSPIGSFGAARRNTTAAVPVATGPAAVPVADGFSQDEIAQFAQLLCSPKKTPPQRYQCHICYNTGHYISDCPMRFNSPYEELTPYQGRKKCYGEFTCQQCKRRWTSQNSVANEAQSCIKCQVPVFPHKQLPVDKAVALGLVKAQRTVPTKMTPIGFGRPQFSGATAAVLH